jgi:hypothetical protein
MGRARGKSWSAVAEVSRERGHCAAPPTVVIPAKAGIQYAAASRFKCRRLWNTGSPAGACHRAARCADPVAGDDSGVFPGTASRSRRAIRARFSKNVAPSEIRGRRKCRVHAAPAVSCAKLCKETHTSIQVQRRQPGIPCAMVLRLITCSPR